jgi:CubicO group peptidase (beta-lactamase class C family)
MRAARLFSRGRAGALFVAAVLALTAGQAEEHPQKTIGLEAYPGTRDLYRFAEVQRKMHGLPALGVGIIREGKIMGLGVAGERAAGSGDWATVEDRFDVASGAKSITAVVAALLVQRGMLRWDMTVAEVFPELRGAIRPAYESVTLEMFLRHRSGLDQWMRSNERWTQWHRDHAGKTATDKRRLFAAKVLRDPPRYPPGTETYYCNDGYLVAGSMIERAIGKPWEETVHALLFEPLGLGSMRFGVSSAGASGMPVWGHERGWFGRARAIKPEPGEYGEPPFGSPGGFLHGSVPDLLRYVDFHIEGARGGGLLLGPESFARLYTPLPGQRFALGWEVETQRDAQGKIVERSIYHGGYSGRARANLWFSPESRTGTVIVYNRGGENAVEAYAPIFYALLAEFGLGKR